MTGATNSLSTPTNLHTGPVIFFKMRIFFGGFIFFLAKKIILTRNIFRPKKYSALKNTPDIFFLCGVFFFSVGAANLQWVKKLSWVIPWVPVGEHGTCGDPRDGKGYVATLSLIPPPL